MKPIAERTDQRVEFFEVAFHVGGRVAAVQNFRQLVLDRAEVRFPLVHRSAVSALPD